MSGTNTLGLMCACSTGRISAMRETVAEKGKDAQVKLGDHTEDQEVLLPLSRLQWDKKREHGQIIVPDEDLVQDKMTVFTQASTRCSKNPNHSVA